MKPIGVAVLLLLPLLPFQISGQQPGSTKLPLAITEKDAVNEWSRTIWDGPLDPKLPSDTEFLLSLSETELLGRFRFKQRCALCHAAQTNLSTATWGPLLTRRNVAGREAAVRERILEGSPRMPAFKYALDMTTIDAIVAYLKKVERLP
ncbi:MAG: cytochrome c [Acidobacteria bacterium]|nr:cytochrome c [Acidobacteriota bacterium]